MIPTSEKLINAPAGPPSASAFPELTSKPGPIIPRQKKSLSMNAPTCDRVTYLQSQSSEGVVILIAASTAQPWGLQIPHPIVVFPPIGGFSHRHLAPHPCM